MTSEGREGSALVGLVGLVGLQVARLSCLVASGSEQLWWEVLRIGLCLPLGMCHTSLPTYMSNLEIPVHLSPV